jgi:hypothetical protein
MIKTASKRLVKNTVKTTTKKKGKKSTKIKIEAKPLTEEQIQEFVRHYNEHGSFPGSKIPCNMTGKLTTCVGPWMIKKIKEFGGPENLLRKYKCRGALKAKKEALKPKSQNKKRREMFKSLKDENKNWDIPKMTMEPPKPMTEVDIAECTRTVCFRPDIFLDNDRYCDGCEFYDVCSNAHKGLRPIKRKK